MVARHFESFSAEGGLFERFFSGDVENGKSLRGEVFRELEHESRFSNPGVSRNKSERARDDSSSEQSIHLCHLGTHSRMGIDGHFFHAGGLCRFLSSELKTDSLILDFHLLREGVPFLAGTAAPGPFGLAVAAFDTTP